MTGKHNANTLPNKTTYHTLGADRGSVLTQRSRDGDAAVQYAAAPAASSSSNEVVPENKRTTMCIYVHH